MRDYQRNIFNAEAMKAQISAIREQTLNIELENARIKYETKCAQIKENAKARHKSELLNALEISLLFNVTLARVQNMFSANELKSYKSIKTKETVSTFNDCLMNRINSKRINKKDAI